MVESRFFLEGGDSLLYAPNRITSFTARSLSAARGDFFAAGLAAPDDGYMITRRKRFVTKLMVQ